ncbi:3-ketoacyl-CoA synthase 11-like protein [Tanacetum coccineum]
MLDFMKKVLERSGLGDSTYLAETYFNPKGYNPSMKDARREVELAIFGSVDMLLAKTGVKKEDIGILIVNCCIYNTEPSLSSIIVNRYKFRENIITYNLVGMGCSAGLLAIGLAYSRSSGGRPVLDELQKTLGFSDSDMEASRMTLYRYGNTSSSSIWYELAYVEAKGRVKKGNRVWQIAFGSGFKCQSVIWRALKSVERDDSNPWTDEIDGFPVSVDDMEPFPVFFESSK